MIHTHGASSSSAPSLQLKSINTSEPKTAAECKRASGQNAELCQSEQLVNTSRRKVRRQDDDYREQEQQRNTSKHKTRRQDADYRQHELTQRQQHIEYRPNCSTREQLVSRFRQDLFMCVHHVISCCTSSQSVSGTLDRPRARVVAPSKTCGHVQSSRHRWR